MSTDPRTQWKEVVDDDEDARFKGYAEEFRAMQARRAHGKALGRALHIKAHVGARAELTVHDGVPDDLRVSLFARPGAWRCFVRYSNGVGMRQPDGRPDVRGLAVKVLGVQGPKLIPGLEAATTQDFLFITASKLPVATPEEFMKLVRAAERGPLRLLPGLIGAFGARRAFKLIKDLASRPNPPSLANAHFYTAAPTRLGPFAVKWSLAPKGSGGNIATGHEGYRDDLVKRLKEGPIAYTLRAQRFVDERTTPIEDAAVEWAESVSPWVDLATLTIPKTDLNTEEAKAVEAEVETMSFDPWHATDELRPLGAVMRARKYAYGASVIARGASSEP